MSNKVNNAKALYLDGIRDGNAKEAVEKYTGSRYTQHSTGVRDGKEGFLAFFEPFIAKNPIRDIDIVRSFDDGQYVFVHAYQNLNNGEAEWVTMDFFDTDENDKIIEHWDVIAAFKGENPSGRTQVDGTTNITDIEHTEKNKSLVRSMIEDLLMRGGNIDNADQYIHPNYIQHNSDVGDGISAFIRLLKAENRPLWYNEIVLLIGCGNFVASLSRVMWEEQEYAQMDLFRLENGIIVEHWDAAEPVPSKEELVNSGKF
ncbi:MAG: nuclear transport factor 2 family protein [Cellvibrionaceae bacterium]